MSVLSAVRYAFPPPRYITLPNVGVDISDSSLKYVQFNRRRARDINLELHAWGDIDIVAGAIEHGYVKNVDALASSLKQFKEVCNAQYVRISLPEERAYIFETTIKRDTPAKEIRGLLEFRLEENVPLSTRDALFDYDIVDDSKDERIYRVVVTVYAKETVLNYEDACRRAGLVPLSFEVEAQAIARATLPPDDKGTELIVDFGKTRSGIGIIHKGYLMYTSTIDTGGVALSTAMRGALGDLTEDELTKIKNIKGLHRSKEHKEVQKAIEAVVQEIESEIELRISYWDTRGIETSERKISKIILCGGSANLAGLPEHIESALGIQTERGHVWGNAFSLASFIPPISERYSYGYSTAVGLALTDFIHGEI